ncbi:MAG: acyl-CoA dehydrogenase family protein [Sagittula sp.]|uniref:acyl-CoA dehydrogenase family protein n=1 Tax=Sagittula sp. TaxID=2038081 RepID=UPI004058DC62
MSLDRPMFSSDHEQFRDTVRKFLETELVPHHAEWEKDKVVPREVWRKAGEMGLLCPNMPEEYGGAGADWLYNVVVIEELSRAGLTGPGFMVHSEMVAPYIRDYASEEVKKEWLPKMVTGEAIGAIGLTEPGAGSDLKNIKLRAVRDGDHYVLNGQKVYISNGQNADIVMTATKTDPDAGAKGVTLMVVPTATKGFECGRNLEKLGLKAQDTSELFYSDVRVPVANRMGEEGSGFSMLMTKLAQERLTQAIRSCAVCEQTLADAVVYVKDRKAFGNTIGDFQNTQFVLAGLEAETTQLRVFVDHCIAQHMNGDLSPVVAAKAKLVASALHCKVVDECLQFYGGYGYMLEYPIARAYIDARIVKIAGGAMEVMKQIIWRDMSKRNS